MKSYRVSVVIEKDADGYFAFALRFKAVILRGVVHEEALENIKDAIRLHIEDKMESGEDIPIVESISIASLEVAV